MIRSEKVRKAVDADSNSEKVSFVVKNPMRTTFKILNIQTNIDR